MGSESGSRRATQRAALVGAGAFVVLAIYAALVAAGPITHGFVAYYGAARLFVGRQLGPQVYDDGWFIRYIQQITATSVIEVFGPNPPTMALMAVPVAFLDPGVARAIWLLASLVCFGAAIAALVRGRASDGVAIPPAVVAFALLNATVFANLRTGQAYLFMCALFAGTAWGLLRRRETVAGICLGLALVLKSGGMALLVLLVARGRWQAVAVTLLVCVAGVIAAASIDPLTWRAYPAYVLEFVARPSASVTAYQTMLGFVRHLCVADAVWNPSPAINCAPIAMVLPAILVGAAVVTTIVRSARAPARVWIAAGVCLSELTLPVAAEPHFVTLAVPLILLWPLRELGKFRLAFVLVLAALLLVPLDYTAHRLTSGWAALGAYPRLYAAWLLWAASMVAMTVLRSGANEHEGGQACHDK